MEEQIQERPRKCCLYVFGWKLINYTIKLWFKLLLMSLNNILFFSRFKKRHVLPPIESELLQMSATALVKKLKLKEVKSVEIMEAYIKRIQDVNPIINCVVQDRFEEAMKEAQMADEKIRKSSNLESLFTEKPLLGVPLSVKETIAVKGMSNNAARSRIEKHIAEKDAHIISLLKNAGAIPIAVTNTPELCLDAETHNPKIGRTLNPYDTRRTPGGSSGGEAALISSAGSVIGVGSDIAGSIRIPGNFCGIFGHKPTPGYINNEGHIPTATDPDWNKYFTLGPMTRYAEDLPLMMKIMTEKNKIERLKLDQKVVLKDIKVFYMFGEGNSSQLQEPPNAQVKKAIKEAIDCIVEKFQCQTSQVELSTARNSLVLATLIMRMKGIENVQQYDEDPDNWGLISALSMVVKKLCFLTSASLSLVMWGPMKYTVDYLIPASFWRDVKDKKRRCRNSLVNLLGDDGVLIYPTWPCEAPFHYTMAAQTTSLSYCTIFTTTGLPSSQVPIRISKDGLPIGIQVVAGPHQDRLCFAVARALEQQLGGWVPPN